MVEFFEKLRYESVFEDISESEKGNSFGEFERTCFVLKCVINI